MLLNLVQSNKKANDIHEGKWNGLGGKFEAGETPEECVIREVLEESGLSIRNPKYCGLLIFTNFKGNDWYVFVFTAAEFSGELIDSPEGRLEWTPDEKLMDLNLWKATVSSSHGLMKRSCSLRSSNMTGMRCRDITWSSILKTVICYQSGIELHNSCKAMACFKVYLDNSTGLNRINLTYKEVRLIMKKDNFQSVIKIFHENAGVIKSSELFSLGVQPRILYAMRDNGLVVQEGRGLYRLANEQVWSDPDLAIVSLLIPKGVICLISALYFHQITTQIPHEVHVALPKDSEKPRIKYPPTQFYWISPAPFRAGVEKHEIDNVGVRVYSVAKTIADCFKFRNRLGLEVALEVLREGLRQKKATPNEIQQFARVDRVERVLLPYLEALA